MKIKLIAVSKIYYELPDVPVSSITASVLKYGILEPLIVCREGKNFRLLDGKKRMAAAEAAGFKKVPCVLFSKKSEIEKEAFLISEQIRNNELTYFEKAEKIYGFIKSHSVLPEAAAEMLFLSRDELRKKMLLLKIPPAKRLFLLEKGIDEDEAISSVSTKEQTVKMAFNDYRIFRNTIEKTVDEIKGFGVSAITDIKEINGEMECVIKLKK